MQTNRTMTPSLFFLSLMNSAAWGGSEELWHRTALHAAAKGHKVGCAFYEWQEKEEKISALVKAGCQIYRLPNKGRSRQNLAQRIQHKISKWKAKQVINTLPFQEYDLTIVNLGGFEIYTNTWKDIYRRLNTYALVFHNYSETDSFKPAKAKRLKQWIKRAAGNFFDAGRIKEVLEQKLAIAIPNPDVVMNPITFASPSTPAPYPPLQEPFVFAMLAEFDTSRKAQDNLVKALASTKWKERPWQLMLYGKGKDGKMLQQLIHDLELTKKVKLMGHVTDVKTALQEAHLVLQMTHRDAMPIAVVEAMAMARPVVVSRVGDMPRWIMEGQNGWVTKDASIEEIDAVMERAWLQKEQWPQAGQQSFVLFKEKFPESPEDRFLQQLSKLHRTTPDEKAV